MGGYIKTWNADRIIGDLHSAYYICAESYRDWETDRKSTRLNSSH